MIEPNVPDEQHPKRMSKADLRCSTRSLKTKVGTRAMGVVQQLAEERRLCGPVGARRLLQHRSTTGGPD